MKASFLTAAVILAAFACLGWRDSSRLASTRERNSRLLAEAAALGITPDPANPREKVRVNRPRETQSSLTTAEYLAFAKDMAQNAMKDEEAMKRVVEMINRLATLNAEELTGLITGLRTSSELDEEARNGAVQLAMMTLTSHHPAAALALLTGSDETLVSPSMRKHFVASAIGSWADDDPMSAFRWIQKHRDRHPELIADQANRSLLAHTATQDPKLAFQLLGDLKFKEDDNAIEAIIDAAKTSATRTATLQALREHAASLPDQHQRDTSLATGLSSLADSVAKEEFQKGLEWIDSAKLTPTELQGFAQTLSAHNILTSDTGRWVEWLGNRPPSAETSDQISTMVGAWTQKDYVAAGNWLTATSEGPAKQAAVRGYIQAVAPYEPETAAQWAMILPAGEDRERALRQVYHHWPKADPAAKAAAEAFAEQHGIKR